MTTSENESTWNQRDFFSRNILAVYGSDHGLYAAFTMYVITHGDNQPSMLWARDATLDGTCWKRMSGFADGEDDGNS